MVSNDGGDVDGGSNSWEDNVIIVVLVLRPLC